MPLVHNVNRQRTPLHGMGNLAPYGITTCWAVSTPLKRQVSHQRKQMKKGGPTCSVIVPEHIWPTASF